VQALLGKAAKRKEYRIASRLERSGCEIKSLFHHEEKIILSLIILSERFVVKKNSYRGEF
jgi:hypothetical protein